MNVNLQYQIARALVTAKRRQSLVGALGVTFGIGMFIALLSFMTGLNNMLDGLVVNRAPHIRLFKQIRPSDMQPVQTLERYKMYDHFISSVKFTNSRINIRNASAILKALSNDSRIIGSTPRIAAPLFFRNGSVDIQGIGNGIDAAREALLFSFDDYMIEGKSLLLNTVENSIILGKGLAERMMVHTGDIVQVVTVDGVKYQLKVIGLFQSGLSEVDNAQSYCSIRTVQKMLARPADYVTDIAVKLNDITQAPALSKEMKQVYGADVEDIQTANAEFETGNRIRLVISYAVGATLLIVAGFGIYNILNMLIYEKMDAIAILKATGFSGTDVKMIFLTIALGTGIVGAVFGSLLGLLLSVIISYIPFHSSSLPTIESYPVSYSSALYLIAITFSVVITAIAGWLPAKKASRIDPVNIIRGR